MSLNIAANDTGDVNGVVGTLVAAMENPGLSEMCLRVRCSL